MVETDFFIGRTNNTLGISHSKNMNTAKNPTEVKQVKVTLTKSSNKVTKALKTGTATIYQIINCIKRCTNSLCKSPLKLFTPVLYNTCIYTN